MVCFTVIPIWCQLKSHVTNYSLPEKPVQVCMLLKHDVRVKFFDSNCVETGVEAAEMDLQYGKLSNDTKLMSIEKSRDELFTSAKASTSVYVIKARYGKL